MTTNDRQVQWPDEVVAENFRAEIRARFEAHNAAYRAKEAAELDQVFRDHPERRGEPGFEVRDSGAWWFYQACEIRIERNNTTMAWSKPWVKAVIVDGEPRVAIEIVLVATWDNSLDAAWKKDGNDKRQVIVELDEDEIRAFLDLLDQGLPPSVRSSIRDRLKVALEYLP